MASLYKRATPSQRRILRAVEGAVKNAADAHRNYNIDSRFARSVAKRAAGTLTAQWPEVLAARGGASSEMVGVITLGRRSQRSLTRLSERKAGALRVHNGRSRIIPELRKHLGILAGTARRVGELERAEGIIAALRLLAQLEKDLTHGDG